MASLVYHAGALGDFLTTLPAISRFKAGRRLVLLGRPAHGALAPHLFEDVRDAGSSRYASLFSSHTHGELPSDLADIDSALVFARAGSPLVSCLVARGVGSVIRQDPFPEPPVHVVDYHLSLFPGPISDEERIPRLALTPVPDRERRGVAIAYGSGSPRKNWPRERFQVVAESFRRSGETVTWIAGPAEEGTAPPGPAWKDLPLSDLAAKLSRCRLYLGNDSGVTHLAAATGCPVVALFGATDARVWSPLGPRVKVIASPTGDIAAILPETVVAECLELWERE